MTEPHPFVTELQHRARECEAAEAEFRATMKDRVAELSRERAFANRRASVVATMVQTVEQARVREIAIAAAIAALRRRLGWVEDTPAREEVLQRYASVAQAAAQHLPREGDEEDAPEAEPGMPLPEALDAFEAWYREARGRPFWELFEHYMPETQLVDF